MSKDYSGTKEINHMVANSHAEEKCRVALSKTIDDTLDGEKEKSSMSHSLTLLSVNRDKILKRSNSHQIDPPAANRNNL
jgi:hypothetical protein